jgi:hypothetical protein
MIEHMLMMLLAAVMVAESAPIGRARGNTIDNATADALTPDYSPVPPGTKAYHASCGTTTRTTRAASEQAEG